MVDIYFNTSDVQPTIFIHIYCYSTKKIYILHILYIYCNKFYDEYRNGMRSQSYMQE